MNRPLTNYTLHELTQLVGQATTELARRLKPPAPAPIRDDDGNLVPGARLAAAQARLERPGAYRGENSLEDVMKDILAPVYASPRDRVALETIKEDKAEREWREAREMAHDFLKDSSPSMAPITQAMAPAAAPLPVLPPPPKFEHLICMGCDSQFTRIADGTPAPCCPKCSTHSN